MTVPDERDGAGADLEAVARHHACRSFLHREAKLLDDRRLEDWLDLLTEDVAYEMPIRLTRERDAETEFSESAYNYWENRNTLEARIERFESEFAWSVDPPSRTRRFVTNVRVTEVDGGEFGVGSYLLLWRSQGEREAEQGRGTFVSAERLDRLRRVDGALRLARREIRLDHTVLPMKNLSVFL